MVKWVKLIDVASVLYGCPFEASLFTEDPKYIPLIRIRDVLPGTPSTYYKGEYQNQYIITKDDILVGMDGNFNLAKWKGIDGVLCQRVCKIDTADNEVAIKNFLYHYLGPVFKTIEENTPGGSVKHLSAKIINGIEIPLPTLSDQQRIVDILDKFEAMVENVEKELNLRQKQYEYYIDLFYGDKEDNLQTMESNGSITRGKRFVRTDIVDDGQPCIHYGDMYTYYGTKAFNAKTHLDRNFPKKMRYAQKGDVVIVGAGENDWDIGVGLVWMGEEPAAVHDACYIYEHSLEPMYVSYFTRSTFYHKQLQKFVSEGKICSFSGTDLGRIMIPVPSLETQQQIVSKLDHFESLIANLKQELELRKKQYEFYREKLLTFQ